jgi:phosphatidylglycerophosphatase A
LRVVCVVMDWKRWVATCFGLGWLPIAPGTWGSLPPAVLFGVLMYSAVPGGVTTAVMLALMVIGSVACLCCAPASIAVLRKNDPGEVVMDEFAAQALTFAAIPLLLPRHLSGGESFFLALLGFLLFRAFDIFKPWPIRKLELLPAGWGVLMDDLVAGIGSMIVLYVVVRLFITGQ